MNSTDYLQIRQQDYRQSKANYFDNMSDSTSTSDTEVDYYPQMKDVCGLIIEKYGGRVDCCHVCAILPTKSPEYRKCRYR